MVQITQHTLFLYLSITSIISNDPQHKNVTFYRGVMVMVIVMIMALK